MRPSFLSVCFNFRHRPYSQPCTASARHLRGGCLGDTAGKRMGDQSYLSIIELYYEHRGAIRELLASIAMGVSDEPLLGDEEALGRGWRLRVRGMDAVGAVALPAGLGVYVYFGARAEAVLLGAHRRKAG
jgi:hypothetical protein